MAGGTWRTGTARSWTTRQSIEVIPIVLGIVAAFGIHLMLCESPSISSSNPPPPTPSEVKKLEPGRSPIAVPPSRNVKRTSAHRKAAAINVKPAAPVASSSAAPAAPRTPAASPQPAPQAAPKPAAPAPQPVQHAQPAKQPSSSGQRFDDSG
jgi:hypothetical protein